MDWFTSDLHLGHDTLIKHRGFSNSEEMKERIYAMFDVLKKEDRVFILGDLAWTPEDAQEIIKYLIFKKRVSSLKIIEGNHDIFWLKKIEEHPKLKVCQTLFLEKQKGLGFNSIFLSHYPQIIFNKSHAGAYQLHGHGHVDTIDRPILDNLLFGKRINVNCELHNYKLLSREDIENMMKEKPINIDEILLKGTEEKKEIVKETLINIKQLFDEMYNKIGENEK